MLSRAHVQNTRWAKWTRLAFAGLVTALLFPDAVFAQCAMCRTAVANSLEGQKLAGALNDGVLFLLSVPFLVVVAIALKIRKAHRNGQEVPARQQSSQP